MGRGQAGTLTPGPGGCRGTLPASSPTPAISSGDAMRPYREWLSADGWEATLSIGGSYVPDSIEGCYQRPWGLGYGRLVKFDHDFVGGEALENAAREPHRQKVWLR
jgi:vanillate/3-O-methylgallate O-demethylase